MSKPYRKSKERTGGGGVSNHDLDSTVVVVLTVVVKLAVPVMLVLVVVLILLMGGAKLHVGVVVVCLWNQWWTLWHGDVMVMMMMVD